MAGEMNITTNAAQPHVIEVAAINSLGISSVSRTSVSCVNRHKTRPVGVVSWNFTGARTTLTSIDENIDLAALIDIRGVITRVLITMQETKIKARMYLRR